jgi:MFS family permease
MHDRDAVRTSAAAPAPALLRDRRFVVVFVAHLVSNLGDWLAFLALWAAVGLNGDAGAPTVAALAIAYLSPLLVVMPIAGACIDRWPLRRVLVLSDCARALVVAGFLWVDSLWGRCALLFALQSFGCLFNPAQAAALVRLVPPSRLLAANALATQAGHAAKLVGPALAGIVVGGVGERMAFKLDAASFAASAALLATLPALPVLTAARSRGEKTKLGRVRADIRAGLHVVFSDARLRRALIPALVACAGLGAWLATFAVVARDRWDVAARGTGFLVSVFGAGAIAGAALAVVQGAAIAAAGLVQAASVAAAGVATRDVPATRTLVVAAAGVALAAVALRLWDQRARAAGRDKARETWGSPSI